MAVSARHLSALGVAVLGAGALVLTPVGPPLQSLNLRNETVPPLAGAPLPGWLAEAAFDLAEIPDAGGRLGADLGVRLPVPGAALPSRAGDAVSVGTALAVAEAAVLAGPVQTSFIDSLEQIVEDPMQGPATLAGLVTGLTTLVDNVVIRVTDLATATFDNVWGLVLAAITIPVAIVGQLIRTGAELLAALVMFNPVATPDAISGVADVLHPTPTPARARGSAVNRPPPPEVDFSPGVDAEAAAQPATRKDRAIRMPDPQPIRPRTRVFAESDTAIKTGKPRTAGTDATEPRRQSATP